MGNATIESSVNMLKLLFSEKTPKFAMSRLKYATLMLRPMLTSKVACTKFVNQGGVEYLLKIHASPMVEFEDEKTREAPTGALTMVMRVIGRRVPILLMDKLQSHVLKLLETDESVNPRRLELVIWILGALESLLKQKDTTTYSRNVLSPSIVAAIAENEPLKLLKRVGDFDREIRLEKLKLKKKLKNNKKQLRRDKRYRQVVRFCGKMRDFLLTISRLVSKPFTWKKLNDVKILKSQPEAQSRVMGAIASLYDKHMRIQDKGERIVRDLFCVLSVYLSLSLSLSTYLSITHTHTHTLYQVLVETISGLLTCPSWKRQIGFELNLQMLGRFLNLGTLSLVFDDFRDIVVRSLERYNGSIIEEEEKPLRSHVKFVWDLLCGVKRAHDVLMQKYEGSSDTSTKWIKNVCRHIHAAILKRYITVWNHPKFHDRCLSADIMKKLVLISTRLLRYFKCDIERDQEPMELPVKMRSSNEDDSETKQSSSSNNNNNRRPRNMSDPDRRVLFSEVMREVMEMVSDEPGRLRSRSNERREDNDQEAAPEEEKIFWNADSYFKCLDALPKIKTDFRDDKDVESLKSRFAETLIKTALSDNSFQEYVTKAAEDTTTTSKLSQQSRLSTYSEWIASVLLSQFETRLISILPSLESLVDTATRASSVDTKNRDQLIPAIHMISVFLYSQSTPPPRYGNLLPLYGQCLDLLWESLGKTEKKSAEHESKFLAIYTAPLLLFADQVLRISAQSPPFDPSRPMHGVLRQWMAEMCHFITRHKPSLMVKLQIKNANLIKRFDKEMDLYFEIEDAAVRSTLPLLKTCMEACETIKQEVEETKNFLNRKISPGSNLRTKYMLFRKSFDVQAITEEIEKATASMHDVESLGTMDDIRKKSSDLDLKSLAHKVVEMLRAFDTVLSSADIELTYREITLDKGTFIVECDKNNRVNWVERSGSKVDILDVYTTPQAFIDSLHKITETKEGKSYLQQVLKDAKHFMQKCTITNESRVLGMLMLDHEVRECLSLSLSLCV